MKALLKSMAVLLLAATMVGAGVFAATSITQNTSSTVGFTATDVFVDIEGSSTVGTAKTYSGKTYESFDKVGTKDPAAWTIGDIALDGATYVASIEFKFTNQGDVRTTIAITEPTLSADSFSMIKKLKLGDAAAVDLVSQVVTLGYGESATFTYTITLTKLNRNVTSLPCNFAVSMTKAA